MERRQVIAGLLGAAGTAGLSSLAWPRRLLAQSGPRRRPPVILLAFDTTRADHLGCYGYGRDTSPNLDRLARESVVFSRCWSQSNETLTSFSSLLSSRLPSELAPLSYESFCLPADTETLQRVLGYYGYQTGGFVAGGHLVRAFGFDRGFDSYRDEWTFGSFANTMPAALSWLDERDPQRPFFLFVQGYDAHAPYTKPLWFEDLFDPDYEGVMDSILTDESPMRVEKIWQGRYFPAIQEFQVKRELPARRMSVLHTDLFSLLARQDPATGQALSPADLAHLVAHYDAGIAYADVQLGLFLEQLQQRGLLDESLIVVFGDHGEDLMEHGHPNHRISLHDASTRVPFIVRFPGGQHGGTRVDDDIALMDLLPTVLDLLEIQAPAGVRGHSLLRRLREGADPTLPACSVSEGILPMGSARTRDHRLVLAPLQAGTAGYLDLLSGGAVDDPRLSLYAVGPGREERLDPTGAEGRAVASDLLAAMREHYRGFTPPGAGEVPYVDPVLEQVMRAKGYW
ncbi:MAG: sulfatase [Pseudomonadota bacterium]